MKRSVFRNRLKRLFDFRRRKLITILIVFLIAPHLISLCTDIFHWKTCTRRQYNTVKMESDNEKNRKNATIQSARELVIKTEKKHPTTICELPGIIHDGIPYPYCKEKVIWMKNEWKKWPCYTNHGVINNTCSFVRYIARIEKQCPLLEESDVRMEPLVLKGVVVSPRTNFDDLYKTLGDHEDYTWIKSRIRTMAGLWIKSAEDLFSSQNDKEKLTKKRIHLHLGLLSLAMAKDAGHGGPVGELVQWSDLIASLYVMGHDIVVTRTREEIIQLYKSYRENGIIQCPTPTVNDRSIIPFDLIYTDIHGYGIMSRVIVGNKFDFIRCRFRIVDSFGTEADFNDLEYQKEKKLRVSQYSGLNLNLRQFNTMFPHTPDNTFLGFVSEMHSGKSSYNKSNRDIAVIYAKQESYLNEKLRYIETIQEFISQVHSTIQNPKNLPPNITNHGVLSLSLLTELLSRTKIFIGLGFPYEGPAPLEAIQQGAVFLNPKLRPPINSENSNFYKYKPTRRKITSQNPYVEKFIGKPHVYTLDIHNETELRSVLREIMESPEPGNYLPYEYTARGMLERVSKLVQKQQLCVKVPYSLSLVNETLQNYWWPPLSALRTNLAQPGKSCNEACEEKNLLCEASFFPVLNRKEAFESKAVGVVCEDVYAHEKSELDYPAYDLVNKACYIQTRPLLFSCSGSYTNFRRLCPCRDFVRGQTAFCKDC